MELTLLEPIEISRKCIIFLVNKGTEMKSVISTLLSVLHGNLSLNTAHIMEGYGKL